MVDNGVLDNHPQDLASHLDTIMDMVVSLSKRVDTQVGLIPHPEEVSCTSQPPPPIQFERRKATTQVTRLCKTSPLIKWSDRGWRSVI